MSESLQAALLERAKREQARRKTAKPQADMSFWGRVKDNVVGVDDGVMSPGEKVGTALNMAGEAMTLGLVGDEAAAWVDEKIGRGTYDERLAHYRGNEAQFREENPALALGAEVAPALIPGTAGAKAVKALSGVAGRTGAAALLGAGSGATYGFMEGEGGFDERLKNAKWTALLGGVVGAGTPAMADAIAGLPKRLQGVFTRAQKRPTLEALKTAKNAAYRMVDESGETFSGDDMAALSGKIRRIFDDGNYVEETDNASRAVLKILERREGQPTTLSQLDNIRKNLWKRYGGAKDQPVILDAIHAIDELIESRAGASDLMGAARAANSKYAKTQLLHDAFEKAKDQTSGTGSGGNILNKYRQAVEKIINDPKKSKFFAQEEIDLMRSFVRGSTGENILRKVGKLSPDGNGLMMALHVIGGISTQGGTLPLMAAGAAAKRKADRGVMRGAELIQDVVSGHARPPVQPQINALHSGMITAGAPVAERSTNALANMQFLPR